MFGPGSPLNRGNIAHTLRSVVWMDRNALSARAAATSLAFARGGGEKLSLGDDLLRGPIYAADPSGRIRLLTVR